MALIKCIECGKEFSDRAAACPNCGCPTNITLDEIKNKLSDNIKIIEKYNIWGYEFVIDTIIDKYIVLLKTIRTSRNVFSSKVEQIYNQINDADTLMEIVPEYFSELLNEMIKIAIGTLNSFEIYDIDSKMFLEKYSATIDASYLMEPIVNKYFEILDMEKAAKEYREYLRHARLNSWTGGGFSIGGAVKGYFKAQILNAGTAFIHSLPDSIKHNQNLAEVSKAKGLLFRDPKTKKSVIDAFLNIFDSCYSSVMNELVTAEKIEKCPFDTEKAIRIINNINDFMIADNWDEAKISQHLLEAFKADPSINDVIKMMLALENNDNKDLREYATKYGFIVRNASNDVSKKREKAPSQTQNKKQNTTKHTIKEKKNEKTIKPLEENDKKVLLNNQISSCRRSLSVNSFHTLGLRIDGTVITTHTRYTGYNNYNELCQWEAMVCQWEDIVSISHSYEHIVGLKADGTVIAAGYNFDGCCDVDSWSNIMSIATGTYHTVGLKKDGTVIAIGSNKYEQCNVKNWSNIVSIYAQDDITVGIKSNGTVVATGDNQYGHIDVSDWQGIVSIAIGRDNTFGLKADGTVVATKYKSDGRNNYSMISVNSITKWENVVSISASGRDHVVALKADGTLLANGCNREGQCEVNSWTNIVEIYAYDTYTIGLKKDGTLIATNFKKAAREFALANNGQCDIETWKNIRVLPTFKTLEDLFLFEQEQSVKLKQEYKIRSTRRTQGVCQYCGKSFKGFILKKCSGCGVEKDY